MKDSNDNIKNFLNRAILLGVIGAAVALVYIFFIPKEYLVIGKVVVFPATSASQKNLSEETGNTVEIVKNFAFQASAFEGLAQNFAYAKRVGDSSVVELALYTQKGDQISAEDAIVRVPKAISEYTRDLYDGNPFKYKLLGDPEVTVKPVRPSLAGYLFGGFTIGVLAYIFYWFLFQYLRVPMEKSEEEMEPKTAVEKKSETAAKSEKIVEPSGEITQQATETNVPENLPFVGEEIEEKKTVDEPSDEEVKDRLNKLMRGEL